MDSNGRRYVWRRRLTATGANGPENELSELNCALAASGSVEYLIGVLLAARSCTKIEKVTLDAVKLTAIFSKRRKIGAS